MIRFGHESDSDYQKRREENKKALDTINDHNLHELLHNCPDTNDLGSTGGFFKPTHILSERTIFGKLFLRLGQLLFLATIPILYFGISTPVISGFSPIQFTLLSGVLCFALIYLAELFGTLMIVWAGWMLYDAATSGSGFSIGGIEKETWTMAIMVGVIGLVVGKMFGRRVKKIKSE